MMNEYYIVKVNEQITTRGMNSLFYRIYFNRVKDNHITTFADISYQRGNIENMLHGTSIFYDLKLFSDAEVHLTYEEVLELTKVLRETIDKLNDVEENYRRYLCK